MPNPNLYRERCYLCGQDVEPGAGWHEKQVRVLPNGQRGPGANGPAGFSRRSVGVTWHDHCSAEDRDRVIGRARSRSKNEDYEEGDRDPVPLDEMFR